MARFAPMVLRRYLLGGQIPAVGCLRRAELVGRTPLCVEGQKTQIRRRYYETQASSVEPSSDPTIPFRKQLKDEAKRRKEQGVGKGKKSKVENQKLEKWELTVGIEIHAQLNTARKLFSSAASTIDDVPNTHVALFDVAMPGSMPTFQKETLIPALRAALALNCDIQKTSRFDRKHYFHWDQPSGYQITQYYEPFAKDGYITLYEHDGIAKEDGESVRIGIKQVQMEQDTAKTIAQPGDVHLLDFNRVGLPLIEIITLPQIHYPSTAAALVRKIQTILNSVDACVLGMQNGGLRADVNVSVRLRGNHSSEGLSYGGVSGLGQRTEIKNLSSFKAVEDAIIAERDRQISVLESGGIVAGETRGWTIGSTETKRLRGKEGEVDYRYMPDPDLSPIVIGEDLLNHLQDTLGILPDQEIEILINEYGLTIKDAMSLISLNDGGTIEYFYKVVDELQGLDSVEFNQKEAGRLVGNWVLHEMGGLSSFEADEFNPLRITPDGECLIPAVQLAQLIHYLDTQKITGKTAKKALGILFELGLKGDNVEVADVIEKEGLWFTPLSDEEYRKLAQSIWDEKVVEEILAGKEGKINFLLGKMMRLDGDGRVDAARALGVLKALIDERRKS